VECADVTLLHKTSQQKEIRKKKISCGFLFLFAFFCHSHMYECFRPW
jgi:hypothetical protein